MEGLGLKSRDRIQRRDLMDDLRAREQQRRQVSGWDTNGRIYETTTSKDTNGRIYETTTSDGVIWRPQSPYPPYAPFLNPVDWVDPPCIFNWDTSLSYWFL